MPAPADCSFQLCAQPQEPGNKMLMSITPDDEIQLTVKQISHGRMKHLSCWSGRTHFFNAKLPIGHTFYLDPYNMCVNIFSIWKINKQNKTNACVFVSCWEEMEVSLDNSCWKCCLQSFSMLWVLVRFVCAQSMEMTLHYYQTFAQSVILTMLVIFVLYKINQLEQDWIQGFISCKCASYFLSVS